MSEAEPKDDEGRMTIGEHLEELRRRLIRALLGLLAGVCAGLALGPQVIGLLKYSYVKVMREMGQSDKLAVFDLPAGLITYLRVSLITGLVIASPWVVLQLWLFVSAGLYWREKRYVVLAAPASAALFLCGAGFFLFVVSVPLLWFFASFNAWLGLSPVIMFSNHVSLMTNLMLVFGLCFQTPLAVLFLAKMGLVTTRQLNHYRRHVIVAILILSACVTSPSPVDQILLAIPMWALFELGVLLAYLSGRKSDPRT